MSKPKPDYLYHYTKASTAIDFILPSNQLLIGQLCKMNDAKENLLHIIDPEEYVAINKGFWWDDYTKPLAKKASENVSLLCFSTDNDYKLGFSLQRMWAQYGDTNKGVCLAIDYNKFIKENQEVLERLNVHNGYINYREDVFNQLANPAKEDLIIFENQKFNLEKTWSNLKSDKGFIRKNFFCKNEDWSGELEYRFLAFSDSSDPIYLSIKNSLDLVVLGVHFSSHLLPSISAIVPKSKIQVLEVSEKGQLILNEGCLRANLDIKWRLKQKVGDDDGIVSSIE